jgi:RimJ/RimL family protein N-acetyltransferase
MTPKLSTEKLILREIKINDLFGIYEIMSDDETMKLFGGPVLTNDLEIKDFIQIVKSEREDGISYFWSIILREEKEFVGFIRLKSYNSKYYDSAFSSIGTHRFDNEFVKYFDRTNGWEIDYALTKSQRNKGIMREAVGAVLEFCTSENISPLYARVNSIKNSATVKILRYHGFEDHLPQVDPILLKTYGAKKIIKKNEMGMIFKWII